jgi:hypothetical protein
VSLLRAALSSRAVSECAALTTTTATAASATHCHPPTLRSAQNWADFKDFTQQVYVSLKQLYPAMALFASYNLEQLVQIDNNGACANTNWGAKSAPASFLACAQSGFATLAGIPGDTFAYSSFPSISAMGPAGGPPSWYLAGALSGLSAQAKSSMVIANTGLLATDLVLNFANSSGFAPPLECTTLVPSSAALQAAWFEQVLLNAPFTAKSKTFVINFRTARDTLFDQAMACPCTAPLPALQPYCDVIAAYRNSCFQARISPAACELSIKAYGTYGVRTLFGQPREPLFSDLQAARQG